MLDSDSSTLACDCCCCTPLQYTASHHIHYLKERLGLPYKHTLKLLQLVVTVSCNNHQQPVINQETSLFSGKCHGGASLACKNHFTGCNQAKQNGVVSEPKTEAFKRATVTRTKYGRVVRGKLVTPSINIIFFFFCVLSFQHTRTVEAVPQ